MCDVGLKSRNCEPNLLLDRQRKAGLRLCATAAQLQKYPEIKRLPRFDARARGADGGLHRLAAVPAARYMTVCGSSGTSASRLPISRSTAWISGAPSKCSVVGALFICRKGRTKRDG
jgi:hypothetical protein